MNISCSGRKPFRVPLSQFVDEQISHAQRNAGIEIAVADIDYVYGFVPEAMPIYGGRRAGVSGLTSEDINWCETNNVGIKLPISTTFFDVEHYEQSKPVLEKYHSASNSVITANLRLTEAIRRDFPLFSTEASVIFDVREHGELNRFLDGGLFDTVVLSMSVTDDLGFLESVERKDRVRLFLNAGCNYTCPAKTCYSGISRLNAGQTQRAVCSAHLGLPRTFFSDIDWSEFYFDFPAMQSLGFTKFKLLHTGAFKRRMSVMQVGRNANGAMGRT